MKRYPGIQPFTQKDNKLFFGRSEELLQLADGIDVNNLVVLYGRSGYGKSSLINAGLIPKVDRKDGYKTIPLRFGTWRHEQDISLHSALKKRLYQELGDTPPMFRDLTNSDDLSIWQLMKSLAFKARNSRNGILLILDQFEEAFTYPKDQVKLLEKTISELLIDRMDLNFHDTYQSNIKNNPSFFDDHKDEVEFLERPIPIKILIGIRSDKLSLLDRFSKSIPTILKNNYQLKPLGWEQAKAAIELPAEKTDKTAGFESPSFSYTSEALFEILDFLSKYGTKPIESFLLQIICQRIENLVIHKSSFSDEEIEIDLIDIGDLEAVVSGYYRNIVNPELKNGELSEFEKLFTRYFVETILIDSSRNNRISLDRTLVHRYGISDKILSRLVDLRLIRQEPNTVSGISYEISHDTLIAPILQARFELGEIEDQVQELFHNKLVEEQLDFILAKFVNSKNKLSSYSPPEVSDEWHDILALEEKNIIRATGQTKNSNDSYEIYPVYQEVLVRVIDERNKKILKVEKSRKRYLAYSVLGVSIAALLIIVIKEDKLSSLTKEGEQKKKEIVKLKSSNKRLEGEALELGSLNKIYEESLSNLKEDSIKAKSEINNLEKNIGKLEGLKQKAENQRNQLSKVTQELQDQTNILKQDSIALAKYIAKHSNQGPSREDVLLKSVDTIIYSNPTIALNILKFLLNRYGPSNKITQKLFQLIGDPKYQFYYKDLTTHNDEVFDIAISGNNRYLVSGSWARSGTGDNGFIKWDIQDNHKPYPSAVNLTAAGNDDRVNKVYISTDGNVVAAGTSKGRLHYWLNSGKALEGKRDRWPLANGRIEGIIYDSEDRVFYAAIGAVKPQIIRYNTNNPKSSVLGLENEQEIRDLQLYDEKLGMVLLLDNSLKIRRFDGTLIKEKKWSSFTGSTSFSFDSKSNLFAILSQNQGVFHGNTFETSKLNRIEDTNRASAIALLNNQSSNVMIGYKNGVVKMVNKNTSQIISEYRGHNSQASITDIEISSGGQFMYTSSKDKTIKVWPLEISNLRKQIIGKYSSIKNSVKTPDEATIQLIRNFLESTELYELSDKDKAKFGL